MPTNSAGMLLRLSARSSPVPKQKPLPVFKVRVALAAFFSAKTIFSVKRPRGCCVQKGMCMSGVWGILLLRQRDVCKAVHLAQPFRRRSRGLL